MPAGPYAAGSGAPSVNARPVARTVLPNGLTVLVRTDRTAPVVAIVTRVNAGYFDEPDADVGISHVLEHMYFKGTPTRGVGAIARETKASGGYLNAHTIYDHTSYEVVLPAASFARGLEIQADAFANSSIDAGELARELEVIIQEAKRKLDSPGAVAMESLYALLHDRHRFRRWRIGEEQGLRALTRDRLLAFYRNFYRPANTILAIVGDVDEDEALAEVERRYGALTDAPVSRTTGDDEVSSPGFRVREIEGDIEQAHMAFGWRTPGPLHADTPALDLAGSILGVGRGSRLYRSIRERQLASSAGAMNYTPRDLGVFVIRTEGDARRAGDAAGAAWAVVRDVRAAGVQAPEVVRAQRLFEARWMQRLETMEGQADSLAEWEGLGRWELSLEYFDRVMALRPDDIRAAVARHLDPDQASLLAYRPRGDAILPDDPGATRIMLDAGTADARAGDPAVTAVVSRPVRRRVELVEQESGVSVFRTSSGPPILVRRRPGAPLVHLAVFGAGGASLEPDAMAGIGTLMARTSVKGTARRDATAIANASELLGGSIGTSVTADGIGWTLSVPLGRQEEAIALLADVVQYPVFPEDALATERSVALSQLAQLRDDMFRYPVRLATAAAFGSHPYGRSLLGSEASLQAVGVDAVREWHRAEVLSSCGVIGAVGDVEEATLAQWLADAFGALTARTPRGLDAPAWPERVVAGIETRDKAQTALAIGFPGARRGDPARFTAELLAGIASGLGGRFFEELREKRSLAYTVHVMPMERVRAGMLLAYIATAPDREEEARTALLAEFGRLRDEPVTRDELERARHYAIGSHAISRQRGAAVLGEMVDAWLFGNGLAEIGQVEERLEAVTAASIRDWAMAAFDPDRRVEGVVRGTVRAGA